MGGKVWGCVLVLEIRPEPVSHRVYTWTRERIVDGTFAAGTMISEGEISEALDVSRTPVREAFLRLASEGVLELFPKRGALVAPVTVADMRNVMEARLLIEPWAAGVASGLANRQELVTRLMQLVSEMAAAQLPAEALQYREADRLFHKAIVAATDNTLIEAFYQSLRDRQLRMGFAALGHAEGRMERSHSEHRAIARAIAAGDTEQAAELVRAHIGNNRAALELKLRVS
jgi:DNA-binding GntR family transcriptional regulator